MRKLFTRAIISFSYRFTGLALQFAVSVYLARTLGPEGYGFYAYAFTIITLMGLILPLGLNELAVRILPPLYESSDGRSIRKFVQIELIIIILVAISTFPILAKLKEHGLVPLQYGVWIIVLGSTVQAATIGLSAVMSCAGKVLLSQFIETIAKPAVYAFLLVVVVFHQRQISHYTAFYLAVSAATITVLVLLVYILYDVDAKIDGRNRPPNDQIKLHILKQAFPLFLASVLSLAVYEIDTLMVGSLLGGEAVGLYKVATRGAGLIAIANMVGIQLLSPELSRSVRSGNSGETQAILRRIASISFVFGGMGLILICAFSETFVGIFGAEYMQSREILLILLICQTILTLSGGDYILLTLLGRQKIVMRASLVGLMVNVVLNYVLIRAYGVSGAAIASVFSIFFVHCFMYIYVKKFTEYDTTILSFWSSRSKSKS